MRSRASAAVPFFAVCFLITLALTVPRPLQAQEARDRLDSAVERLERDRAAQLEFLAPRSFEQAEEAIERGRRAAAEGGTDEEIERRAEEAHIALAEGELVAERTSRILEEPLQARAFAAAARAPDFAADEWATAEKELREAGLRAERQENDAPDRAVRAAEAYRQAQRSAILV